ncbi:MAG: response regulator transcription factor [Chloroflexota bacterium]|nr:response regulator transcription factor [Chloroflexota bacterium]
MSLPNGISSRRALNEPLLTVRALIVADSPLARAGLAAMLDQAPGLTVVAQMPADADIAALIDVYRPDVIAWDMGYDPAGWLDAIAEARDSGVPILALVADTQTPDTARAILSAGARGVLPHDTPTRRLAAGLIALSQGMVVLHPTLIEVVLPTPSAYPNSAPNSSETLTPRESEVLHLIAEGLPNKTIALKLGISEHTVKFHVNAILTKFGAQSRTEAVVRATRAGLIAL